MTQSSDNLTAAVVGASGYAGSVLTGLLLNHPNVTVTHLYVSERSADAGKPVAAIDARLTGRTDLTLEPLTDRSEPRHGVFSDRSRRERRTRPRFYGCRLHRL